MTDGISPQRWTAEQLGLKRGGSPLDSLDDEGHELAGGPQFQISHLFYAEAIHTREPDISCSFHATGFHAERTQQKSSPLDGLADEGHEP